MKLKQLRGGTWYDVNTWIHRYDNPNDPNYPFYSYGFRVVSPPSSVKTNKKRLENESQTGSWGRSV